MDQRSINALSEPGTTKIPDSRGLAFEIRIGKRVTARNWVITYHVAGVQKQHSLEGNLPLKDAREVCAKIRTAARQGIDIVADGKAEAKADHDKKKARQEKKLGVIVADYLVYAAKTMRPASFKCTKLYLTGHWELLHNEVADEITRKQIANIRERYGETATAQQMLKHLSACLSWALDREKIDKNVCIGIKSARQKPRERVLSETEIKTLWLVTETYPDKDFAAAIRLLLLTGQRLQEIGQLQRSEVSFERQAILLPGTRTKNHREHEIPLSRQAMAILQDVMGDGDRVIRSLSWSQAKLKLDKLCGFEQPWTIHDLRRTFATHTAEIGIEPHYIEAILNHMSGHKSGVAGTYNHARYRKQKINALQSWADHIDKIVSGETSSKIVQFA